MPISKLETRLIHWVQSHLLAVLFAAVTLLGLGARMVLAPVVSADAEVFLLPWYDLIQEQGGLPALQEQVGNYNMLYQFLIALLTYLPIPSLYAYKLLSGIFDFGLAFCVGRIVWDLAEPQWRKPGALLGYSLVLFSPIVIVNSSSWAQCDSIYVFFIFAALVCLYREKWNMAFVWYGVSVACKLQAVFVLPFFLMVWFLRKRFSLLTFLWVPAMLVLTAVPSILMGRSPLEIIGIYLDQTTLYPSIYLSYPSAWALFLPIVPDFYKAYMAMALVLALAGLLLWAVIFIRKNVKFTGRNLMYMLFILCYTATLLMPSMHERYGYAYEIAAIVIAALDRRTWGLLITITAITLMCYSIFLHGSDVFPLSVLAVANTAAYLLYSRYILNNLESREKETSIQ